MKRRQTKTWLWVRPWGANITTVFCYFSSRETTHDYVLLAAVFRCFGIHWIDTVASKYGAKHMELYGPAKTKIDTKSKIVIKSRSH